jgi:hypothetical protein
LNCPSCGREVLVRRVGPGARLPGPPCVCFAVSGPCPSCGVRLFGWTRGEKDEPAALATAEGFVRWRASCRRRAAFTPVTLIVCAMLSAVCAGLVALAVWAIVRAFALTYEASGRLALSLGPSVLLLGVALIVYLEASEIRAWRHADRDQAYRRPPDGLSVLALPSSYRG